LNFKKTDYSPLVSVVCMCFNHQEYVIESLNSVKNQTYKNIEILINDDYSSDNSVSEINKWLKFNKATVINFNSKNIGNTKSFNALAKHTKGEYLIDLATDDILMPNAIEKHIENFRKNNYNNGVSFGNAEYIDKNRTHIKYHYPVNNYYKVIEKPLSGDIYKKMLSTYHINSCTMMISKDIFKILNGYDNNLHYEDLDFILRASRVYPFFFCDAILIKKRELENSLGNQFKGFNSYTLKLEKSTFKIFKKALKMNVSGEENKALSIRVKREVKKNLKNLSFFMAFKNSCFLTKLIFKI